MSYKAPLVLKTQTVTKYPASPCIPQVLTPSLNFLSKYFLSYYQWNEGNSGESQCSFLKNSVFFKKNIQQIFTPFSLETWWHKWPKDAFKKNKNVFRTHYLYLCAYMLSRFSCVQLFQTLGTVAHLQPVPLFWDSSGKNTGGLPCPLPGDCPNPGMESMSLVPLYHQAGSSPLVPPGEPYLYLSVTY